MSSTVPIHALATAIEDIDELLTEKFLFTTAAGLHRNMEYLWGLEIFTIDPTHERSILHIRRSLQKLPKGEWTLVPTEATLSAMLSLQKNNAASPISDRQSLFNVFSAPEYEYIFVPLWTDVDFFIHQSGHAPQRFTAPYFNFPLVTSSVNPFFATFHAMSKIYPPAVSSSKTWCRMFNDLTYQWRPFPLPEEFLLSCYPDDFRSESAYESDTEAHSGGAESKSGSEETVIIPVEEGPSPVPGKEALVYQWVQHDADPRLHRRLKQVTPTPWPPAPRDEPARPIKDAIRFYPCWHLESKRGIACSQRLWKRPPPPHLISPGPRFSS
ncbi:hypothetical protein C8J56DRAFT_912480 [Mycena floridula]|nr:hypothetical protein C8J56DRAFT_912480 [Mycena floridula]